MTWDADAQRSEGGVTLEALGEGWVELGGGMWSSRPDRRVCLQSSSHHPAALPKTSAITAVIKAKPHVCSKGLSQT